MTSEEIKERTKDFKERLNSALHNPQTVLPVLEISTSLATALFVGEVAYQLAVLNEHLKEVDASCFGSPPLRKKT